MKRIAILMLTGVLVLSGADHAQAGGFLKRLFGKRQCAPATCYQPAARFSCSSAEAACSASGDSPCAAPCSSVACSSNGCGVALPCFYGPGHRGIGGRPLPAHRCQRFYEREVACCERRLDGEAEAQCKYVAWLRYLYCTGQIGCRTAAPCGYSPDYCQDPMFGCPMNDQLCYYSRYPCCMYGMNCDQIVK